MESREIRVNVPSTNGKVDLRMHKCMPPIKDQGTCGACWSFAALNLVEFANCLKKGLTSPVILSEQNLVDCTYTKDGCAGGFYTAAWNNANNTASNASYPYTSGKTGKWNGKCTFTPAKVEAKVSTYKYLTNEAGTELAQNNSQPVAVAIQVVGSKFFYYKSGIYNDVVSCNASVIGTSINHAVTLVGYNNTNSPPYWILRNSWGATWGISGYMYFQKNINLCNVGLYPYGAVTLK